MKKYIFIALICCFFSCGSKVDKLNYDTQTDGITVVKFMYANNYAIAINEDSFWQEEEEHAKLKLFVSNPEYFLEDIKKFKKSDASEFGVLKYAFLIQYHKIQDTIYSDTELDHWKYKGVYYSGFKGTYAQDLKTRYGFFKSCW